VVHSAQCVAHIYTSFCLSCSKNEVSIAASRVDVANHNKCKYTGTHFSVNLVLRTSAN
jgi:hypothetical protein